MRAKNVTYEQPHIYATHLYDKYYVLEMTEPLWAGRLLTRAAR